MSWNEEYNLGNAKIDITWECPRCGYIQKAIDIFPGSHVYCENVNVCGKDKSYFWLSICGIYKNLSDLPLVTIKDKNGNAIEVGNMVRFKEDRYTFGLAIVEKLTSSGNLWCVVCGGGGSGNRLIDPCKAELITSLDT